MLQAVFARGHTSASRAHFSCVYLLDALGLLGARAATWALEHVLDRDEGTNFDVHAELESGTRLFIEAKLSEAGCGTCTPDDAHRVKLRSIYQPRLASFVAPGALTEDAFFPNYQLFRNVSYLDRERPIASFSSRLELTAAYGVSVRSSARACFFSRSSNAYNWLHLRTPSQSSAPEAPSFGRY